MRFIKPATSILKENFCLSFRRKGLGTRGSYSAGLFAIKDVSRQIEEMRHRFHEPGQGWVIEPQLLWVFREQVGGFPR